jgi:hypothetical protein
MAIPSARLEAEETVPTGFRFVHTTLMGLDSLGSYLLHGGFSHTTAFFAH